MEFRDIGLVRRLGRNSDGFQSIPENRGGKSPGMSARAISSLASGWSSLFVHVPLFLFHGAIWLLMVAVRKILQGRYKRGFSAQVLMERYQLQRSLGHASNIVFRSRKGK